MVESTFRSLMAMAYGSIAEAIESMSHALNAANTEEDWCLSDIYNRLTDAHVHLRLADDTVRTICNEVEKEINRIQKEAEEAADDD